MTVQNKEFKNSITDDCTKIPNELLQHGLKPNSFRVMVCLLSHKDGYTLGKAQIMAETTLGKKALANALKDLQELNMITYKPGTSFNGVMKTSSFETLPIKEWLPTGKGIEPKKSIEEPTKETHKEPNIKNIRSNGSYLIDIQALES